MYCDYRIATTSKKTVLGLPEVKLGLMPGMAGTYHLPKLIGYREAFDAMLTGKNIRADKAKKLGLVDLVVDPDALEKVAIDQAKLLAQKKLKPSVRNRSYTDWFLESNPIGRYLLFNEVKKSVEKGAKGKYPAPYAIYDVIKDNEGKSKSTHLADEADKFAKLAQTPESEALIGLFLGMSAVKKHGYGSPAHPIANIAVLGAGLMGAGITQVSAENGMPG